MTAALEPPHYTLMRHQIDDFAADCRANAPWLEPIAEALRCGCGHMIVMQHAGAFRLPRKPRLKPTITTIGDDLAQALGPSAFHLPSLRRLFRAAVGVAVVSGAPEPLVYRTMAAQVALSRQHVVIVETRIEQEIPWLDLIQKTAPKLPILLSTVPGGTA
ncbi:MAG: hypothetical protein ACREJ5_17080 [Geminicoccaceae bacterium]